MSSQNPVHIHVRTLTTEKHCHDMCDAFCDEECDSATDSLCAPTYSLFLLSHIWGN